MDRGIATLSGSQDQLGVAELCLLATRIEVERFEEAKLRRASPEVADRAEAMRRFTAEARALAPATPRGDVILRLAEAEATRVDPPGAEGSDAAAGSGAAAWRAAVRSAEIVTEPYPTAYGHWRLAEALLGPGMSRSEAADSLRLAYEGAVDLRAAPLVAEICPLAGRARIDLESPESAAAVAPPAIDPRRELGLSEREVEVLVLVALGRTNRQIADELFITEKTAGHHVSNILSAKLDVANRMEAAAVAHRAGLTTPE